MVFMDWLLRHRQTKGAEQIGRFLKISEPVLYSTLFDKGSGLHPVPTITMGIWLLCRLLTSV